MLRQWAERLRAAIDRAVRAGPAENDETGQGLVEYALILALVVIVAFIVLIWVGPWVGNVFSNIVNLL
ncbi:MAG: Flp family type IVb pilin [Candidatus Flexifilum sp.]|jgi:pilus assembly protein Flp/PilA